jgi:NitT/TauT family transport system ATP-binding protein
MKQQELILGFLPLLDCAILAVAAERGFAADEGLELNLVRESSWANIRDRLIVGHFHAAHMLGPMSLASSLGLGHLRVPMIAPIALGLGGNAITVSAEIWDQMRRHGGCPGAAPRVQGAAFAELVRRRAATGLEPLTLAMVYPFSCHNYELRYWLAATGVDPDRDVNLVVLPPPLLVAALRERQIDGFCVGEPWSSLAVDADAGRIVCATSDIWRHAPEKVLGLRADWALEHAEEVAALVRACYRAAAWCADVENHADLAVLLSAPRYVDASPEVLARGLAGRLMTTTAAPAVPCVDFLEFAPHAATLPRPIHALWFYAQMHRWGQVTHSERTALTAREVYRPDLYRAALAPLGLEIPNDESSLLIAGRDFFDGREFKAV